MPRDKKDKDETKKPEPKSDDTGIGTLTSVHKAQVLGATAEVIEQVEAVAKRASAAEIDESAESPEVLAKMLADAGDRLHAEAAKLFPDYAEKAKVAKAEAEAEETARLEKAAYDGWLEKWEHTTKATESLLDRVEQLEKSVESVAALKEPLDRVYHQLRTAISISKSAFSTSAEPVGNGQPADESETTTTPSAPAKRVIWPSDLATGRTA